MSSRGKLAISSSKKPNRRMQSTNFRPVFVSYTTSKQVAQSSVKIGLKIEEIRSVPLENVSLLGSCDKLVSRDAAIIIHSKPPFYCRPTYQIIKKNVVHSSTPFQLCFFFSSLTTIKYLTQCVGGTINDNSTTVWSKRFNRQLHWRMANDFANDHDVLYL